MAVFTLGLTIGGATISSCVWVLSGLAAELSHQSIQVALVVIAGLGLARDLGLIAFPLPEKRRLIPQSVFRRGPIVGSFSFGLELGTGVRTYIPTTTPYVLACALVFATPVWSTALLTGATFGLGRSIGPWQRYLWSDKGKWEELFGAEFRLIVKVCAATTAVAIVGFAFR